MLAILQSLGTFFIDLFKSRRRLEAENLFLRHQLNVALRRCSPRLRLRGSDRALLVLMTRLWPCRECERISQAPAPFHVLPRGFAGPSLLAMILFEKYGQHQPLNRQSER